jgi:hypothetical protein
MQEFQARCNTCTPECLQLLNRDCSISTPFGAFREFVSYAKIGYTLRCNNLATVPTTTLPPSYFSQKELELFQGDEVCKNMAVFDTLKGMNLSDYTNLRVTITQKVADHKCKTGKFELPDQPGKSSAVILSPTFLFLFLLL